MVHTPVDEQHVPTIADCWQYVVGLQEVEPPA